jgi:pimeloyl-ACP methyl ester carboxylesterase
MKSCGMSLEKVASADGTSIAIERTGHGKPLLVIHGAASSRQRWLLSAPALGEGRELILMDRRGRGDSTDGTAYRIEQEYDDLAAVVAHIGKPLDILAHSYGALITIGTAPRLQLVDNIVLYEPPLRFVSSDPGDLPGQIDACVARGDLEGGLRLFLRQVGVTEADVEKLRALPNWPQRLTIVPTIPREMRVASALTFPAEHLGKIRHRILLQLGSDSPPSFGTAIEALSKALPNAKVEILAGQKHQAMDTNPALFVKSVRTFLGDGG